MLEHVGNKKQTGFSIIELGVVLSIVSVIGGSFLLVYSEQREQAKDNIDKADLVLMKQSLIEFADNNHYMPCPDTDGDGLEDRVLLTGVISAVEAVAQSSVIARTTYAPTLPGVERVDSQPEVSASVNVCAAHRGGVPYQTIGLARITAYDQTDQAYIYAVDQGVTVANNMLNCPVDTACFFNRDQEPAVSLSNYVFPYKSLPAYDWTTQPVSGGLGANNLQICAQSACDQVLEEGLIAVLLSQNDDTHTLGEDEAENADSDSVFVSRDITATGDLFNDQLIGIAGRELSVNKEVKPAEFWPNGGSDYLTPTSQRGEDVSLGESLVGDVSTQTFEFGEEAANKQLVVTFDTVSTSGWSDAGDSASVTANGDLAASISNNSTDGSHEVIVTADANGEVELAFLVDTDSASETLDFSNIELTYYELPYKIPSLPSVQPIDGITQTSGLTYDANDEITFITDE